MTLQQKKHLSGCFFIPKIGIYTNKIIRHAECLQHELKGKKMDDLGGHNLNLPPLNRTETLFY